MLGWLAIAERNGWWSHHLLGRSCDECLARWLPNRFQMDCASFLAFKVDLEPIVASLAHAKRGEFDRGLSDKIAVTHVFVKNFEMHIITDILNIDFEKFVAPFGIFARILHGLGADALLASVDHNVGVHLTEGLGVTR